VIIERQSTSSVPLSYKNVKGELYFGEVYFILQHVLRLHRITFLNVLRNPLNLANKISGCFVGLYMVLNLINFCHVQTISF
jgi:hypothetical protein